VRKDSLNMGTRHGEKGLIEHGDTAWRKKPIEHEDTLCGGKQLV
jgi:hypothetical protein